MDEIHTKLDQIIARLNKLDQAIPADNQTLGQPSLIAGQLDLLQQSVEGLRVEMRHELENLRQLLLVLEARTSAPPATQLPQP